MVGLFVIVACPKGWEWKMVEIAYRGEADKARMLALVRAFPAENIHVVDLPYRLCSWAFDSPANVALWEDERGELLAWAALQSPFWKLDYALHPAAPPAAHATVLAWANARAAQLLDTSSGRPSWFVAVMDGQTGRRRDLAVAGFTDQSGGEEPWSQVLFRRDGRLPVPPATPRPGFAVRPLRGAAEVAAYVTLHREVFGTPNMTEAWRRRTLDAPGHRPELDLVATNAAGELVGFVIGWWWDGPDGPVAQVEPFGVREDARRYGIAWALMFELLRRLGEAGAAEVRVMTDRYRDAAFAFYQACDFQIVGDVAIYRRDCASVDL